MGSHELPHRLCCDVWCGCSGGQGTPETQEWSCLKMVSEMVEDRPSFAPFALLPVFFTLAFSCSLTRPTVISRCGKGGVNPV